MDPAGHQQPTSPAGGAAGYYPPPPGAAAAPPATGYYPPPPQAAAAATAQPAADGQPAARPHYAAAAGAGAVPAAAPAAAAHAPATAVAPGVGSKRPYEESSAAAAAGGYSHAAADGAVKRQQLGAAAAAPAAAAPAPAAAAPVTSGRPSAASIPRETIYRLVLDVVDTALIIGRGGNTVRSIEQATGGRIKRLQEPPGAREQTLVIWSNSRELPAPNRMGRNTAQEALLDCVKRVVFQENAPMGQPANLRFLIGRSQEAGVVDNIGAIMADNPGVSLQIRRELPPCALDNDVIAEVRGEKYALMAAVELLSHVLREHPILERPGGAPPSLRAGIGASAAGPPAAAPPAQPPAGGYYGAPPAGAPQYGAPAPGYAAPAPYGARPY